MLLRSRKMCYCSWWCRGSHRHHGYVQLLLSHGQLHWLSRPARCTEMRYYSLLALRNRRNRWCRAKLESLCGKSWESRVDTRRLLWRWLFGIPSPYSWARSEKQWCLWVQHSSRPYLSWSQVSIFRCPNIAVLTRWCTSWRASAHFLRRRISLRAHYFHKQYPSCSSCIGERDGARGLYLHLRTSHSDTPARPGSKW